MQGTTSGPRLFAHERGADSARGPQYADCLIIATNYANFDAYVTRFHGRPKRREGVSGVNASTAFLPTFDPELFDPEGIHEEGTQRNVLHGGRINYRGELSQRCGISRDAEERRDPQSKLLGSSRLSRTFATSSRA